MPNYKNLVDLDPQGKHQEWANEQVQQFRAVKRKDLEERLEYALDDATQNYVDRELTEQLRARKEEMGDDK